MPPTPLGPRLDAELKEQAIACVPLRFAEELSLLINEAKLDWLRPALTPMARRPAGAATPCRAGDN